MAGHLLDQPRQVGEPLDDRIRLRRPGMRPGHPGIRLGRRGVGPGGRCFRGRCAGAGSG
jgi:hypothetical protein